MEWILCTGGAGFIGSHTIVSLVNSGRLVVCIDNYSNSSKQVIGRIKYLIDADKRDNLIFVEGDIRNRGDIDKAFESVGQGNSVASVIHFAGLKSVGESVDYPLKYWDVNVKGTLELLNAMLRYGCKSIVFSSSATIYGIPEHVPVLETAKICPISPYGKTKVAIEDMLADIYKSDSLWRIVILRYFNPVGAHKSGLIGEYPKGRPNNLFPLVGDVAAGLSSRLKIFGGDWPTPDGTGIRDYIHVMDLAEGHKSALEFMEKNKTKPLFLNLGSGQGHSVLEVIHAYEKASMNTIEYDIVERRKGDAAISIADPSQAKLLLNWQTHYTLLDMCQDSWKWHCQKANLLEN